MPILIDRAKILLGICGLNLLANRYLFKLKQGDLTKENKESIVNYINDIESVTESLKTLLNEREGLVRENYNLLKLYLETKNELEKYKKNENLNLEL